MTFDLSSFLDKDIVFVGAGKGRAMAGVQTFLETHAAIRSFTGVDKKSGTEPLAFLKDYDQTQTIFIKNEAIPGPEMPVAYVTALQIFFGLVGKTGAKTVGITGTKGKTTTAALTAHILKTANKQAVLAGNIGVSPLPALETATTDTIFVLEQSSYQLSDMTASPHISACTNLYNDHTDWHGSLAAYWEAKHNIMRFAGADDLFVYNADFPELVRWAEAANCRTTAIAIDDGLDLSQAQLFGEHNRLNALIAQAICRELGVDDATIQQAVNSFVPVQHRMQVVATKQTRTYIDDAIGMTPESTMASLRAIHDKYGQIGCLFLGGQDRNYDFSNLMPFIAQYEIPNLVFFPETTAKMKAALPEDYHPQIYETTSMQQAVNFAAKHAPENSVVLLSTAAPSYLLWKDFEDKGDQFQACVQALSS